MAQGTLEETLTQLDETTEELCDQLNDVAECVKQALDIAKSDAGVPAKIARELNAVYLAIAGLQSKADTIYADVGDALEDALEPDLEPDEDELEDEADE